MILLIRSCSCRRQARSVFDSIPSILALMTRREAWPAMRFSRICFTVADGRIHDIMILFVNDFVNSFGSRTVAKCHQLDDFVNSFGGLVFLNRAQKHLDKL